MSSSIDYGFGSDCAVESQPVDAGIVDGSVIRTEVAMMHHHWEHFLAMESDLEGTTRFVELSRDNYSTYSVEFTRILLASSSEIDVVAKALCQKIDPQRKVGNIDEYREVIKERYGRFSTIEVALRRYEFSLRPWEQWGNNANPSWWRSYNNVKHHRDTSFREGNLENALLSVAGLFALVLYYYRDDLRKDAFCCRSKLMSIKGAPEALWYGEWVLPDD